MGTRLLSAASALLLAVAWGALFGETASAVEEARAGRVIGPGVNIRTDLGLLYTDIGLEPSHASGTATPTNSTQAGHEVGYAFSSLRIPLEISVELHPYFKITGRAAYLDSWLSAEWMAGSAFVASGDPNDLNETARLDPGFAAGIGAEGIYPIEPFRFVVSYSLDYGRAAVQNQRFLQANVAGDFSFVEHRFSLSVGTKFRFLTPYLGVGGVMFYGNAQLHEKLPVGSSSTAGSWHIRYEETTPFFLFVGLDAEVGEGVAGLRFSFIGEYGAEFYLGVRV